MRRYIESALDDERAGCSLPFIIRLETGQVVGSTRFLDLAYWTDPGDTSPEWRSDITTASKTPSVAEIGATWLAPSAQGTGVNAEAKLLMLAHAFDTWKVHRVTFKTDARNTRSRRAIERTGAAFEGIRRAHVPATDGSIRHSAYYSIIRAEWPDVHARLKTQLRRI